MSLTFLAANIFVGIIRSRRLTATMFLVLIILSTFSPSLLAMTLSDEPDENRETMATNIPEFLSKGSDIIVKENSSIVLECNIKDLGEYVLMWKFTKRGSRKQDVFFAGNIAIQRKDGVTRYNASNGIAIKQFTSDFVGEYACEISSHPPKKIVYKVSMMTAPIITPTPAKGHISIRKNDRFALKCDVKPSPAPVSIQWIKNDNPTKILEDNSTVFEIVKVESKNEGDYTCIAQNEIGEKNFTFNVNVLYEPEIDISEKIIHGPIGDDIEVRCNVKANPLAEIFWKFSNNSQIRNSRKHEIKNLEKNSILRIRNINMQDYDTYYCEASNSIGTQTVFFEVTGRPSKPKFTSPHVGGEGDSYLLKWTLFSQSPIRSYLLRLRDIDHSTGTRGEWQHYPVLPTNKDDGPVRKDSFTLPNLSQIKGYEIDLEVENEHGKTRSDIFSFSSTDINGAYTPNGIILPICLSLGAILMHLSFIFQF